MRAPPLIDRRSRQPVPSRRPWRRRIPFVDGAILAGLALATAFKART